MQPTVEESTVTTFEAFPSSVAEKIDLHARKKQAATYVPPGGVPKVGEKYVQPNRVRNIQVEGMPMAIAASAPIQAEQPKPSLLTMPASEGTLIPADDAEAVSVGLPSRFYFYGFKDLYITPFKTRHLAKLSRASKEGSTQQLVEVVSSVLKTSSGEANLGFKLTVNDFYWVLYWLRLNGYTKTVYSHTAICTNKEHYKMIVNAAAAVAKTDLQDPNYLKLVAAKDSLESSIRTVHTVTKSNLEEIIFDPTDYETHSFELSHLDLELRPTTMYDIIEILENPLYEDCDQEEAKARAGLIEEFEYLSQLASFVYVKGRDDISMADRIAIVEELPPDDVKVIQDYEKAVTYYGTVDSVNLTCKGCGASWVSKITLEAHHFLPSSTDAGNN